MFEALQNIDQSIFLPFTITGIGGWLLWSLNPRVARRLRIGIAVIVLGMVIWRCMVPIVSSRYACILILPALFGTVYLLRRLAEYKILPAMFLGLVLVSSSLYKGLHVSPYENTYMRAAYAIKADMPSKNVLILDYTQRDRLLAWYSGVSNVVAMPYLKDVDKLEKNWRVVPNFQPFYDMVYLVCQTKERAPQPEAFLPNCRTIFERPSSRRKQAYVRVIALPRITQHAKLNKCNDGTSNRIMNGDFESFYQLKTGSKQSEWLIKNENYFFLDPRIKYPRCWILIPYGYLRGTAAEVEVCEKAPIAGKYSLRLRGNAFFAVLSDVPFPGDQVMRLTFKIRGLQKGTLMVQTLTERSSHVKTIIRLPISAGAEQQEIICMIPCDESEPERTRRLVLLLENGELLLDDIALYDVDPQDDFLLKQRPID